jgi:hypothetical protein
MGLVNKMVNVLVEGYTNPGGTEAYKSTPVYSEALAAILALIISLIIVAFAGLWLWNYSIVSLFEFARPAKSIFQILGLMIFVALIDT